MTHSYLKLTKNTPLKLFFYYINLFNFYYFIPYDKDRLNLDDYETNNFNFCIRILVQNLKMVLYTLTLELSASFGLNLSAR